MYLSACTFTNGQGKWQPSNFANDVHITVRQQQRLMEVRVDQTDGSVAHDVSLGRGSHEKALIFKTWLRHAGGTGTTTLAAIARLALWDLDTGVNAVRTVTVTTDWKRFYVILDGDVLWYGPGDPMEPRQNIRAEIYLSSGWNFQITEPTLT